MPGLPESPRPSSRIMALQAAVAAEFRKSMNDFYDITTRVLNVDSESHQGDERSKSHHE